MAMLSGTTPFTRLAETTTAWFAVYGGADEPTSARIRARQLQAVSRLTPLAMGINLLNVLLVVWVAWRSVPRAALLLWSVTLGAVALRGVWLWQRSRHRPPRQSASRHALDRAALNAGVLGGLWAALPLMAFPSASPGVQLLVATVVTGLLCAGGFVLATVPVAGTVYVLALALGAAGALGLSSVPEAPLITALLALYALIVLASIWNTARLFVTRLLAEDEADAARERLRLGQLFANIGTWEWDITTGALFWTERIAPLFGYAQGSLKSTYDNFIAAVHPDDRQAVIDAVAACVEHDVPYGIEHRVVWPDGTVRWLLERGAVQRDAAGKPLNMIGVVQDINDRKQAELVLAERERQLLEAQRLASIGNWSADLASGELVWSDEIYRIFGHEPGSFAPSVQAFHAAVHPDDSELVRESEQLAEQTGRHDVVHRILRPDGSVRHVHELAQMQADEAGKPLRLTGTVQDVTERVVFEQALVAARDSAERANQAKSGFLSSMSHELRTPMNAILGFGQLMDYDGTLPAEHRDNVKEILKAGRHLLGLINEVLDLAKVESGHIDLSLEPVELAPVVDECIALLTPLAARRGIALGHETLPGATVRADRMRLKQALLNLLSNAVKYNRQGGTVLLDVKAAGADDLRIRVTDSGAGMPSDRLAELFQPFNRLGAEAGGIEGTGIGLTITRRIVELMGGTVGVESEVGVGSCFWIELPRELPAAPHPFPGAPAPMRAVSAGPDAADRHTVLYIEDNPANLKLVAQILAHVPNIHLLTAHTPSLGIELALARRPALILLDIHMPGMDGYQVLRVFQAEASLQHTPVIAITANAMPRDIERGMAAGFVAYLTKPIQVDKFLARVQGCLARADGAGEGSSP